MQYIYDVLLLYASQVHNKLCEEDDMKIILQTKSSHNSELVEQCQQFFISNILPISKAAIGIYRL